jgi:AcrB/AcrD/AcrF family
VPVAFMTGQIGRYFYSFGITSAAAILISMFISFTLTPALCAMWMKKEDTKSDHSTTKSSGFYAKLDAAYGRMLTWSLHHRALMLGIAAVVVASAAFLYPFVGKELVPDDDQSEFSVNLRLPRGTSFERTLAYMTPIEGELRQALGANLESMMTSIQNGSGNYSIQLKPLDQREQSQQQLMQVARRTLSKYRNARIGVSGGTDISGASTGGGGGGGGRGGGRGGLGQGGTVKQTADALTVERTVGENKVTATYKLDGTESKNSMMGRGGQAVESVSTAKWDGPALVITTKMDMGNGPQESTQKWTVSGSTLTIETTNARGTQKMVYKK